MEVNEWKSVAATGRRGRVLPSSYQAPQQISTEGECAGGEGRSSRTLPPLPPVRLMMTVERFRSRTVHASRSVHHIRAGLGHPPPWQTPYPAQHSIQSRAAHGAAWQRRCSVTRGRRCGGRGARQAAPCSDAALPPTRTPYPSSPGGRRRPHPATRRCRHSGRRLANPTPAAERRGQTTNRTPPLLPLRPPLTRY